MYDYEKQKVTVFMHFFASADYSVILRNWLVLLCSLDGASICVSKLLLLFSFGCYISGESQKTCFHVELEQFFACFCVARVYQRRLGFLVVVESLCDYFVRKFNTLTPTVAIWVQP